MILYLYFDLKQVSTMKRISILLTLTYIFSVRVVLYAQIGTVPISKIIPNLEMELKAAELAVDPTNPKSAKTAVEPASWIKRGEIFHAIFKDKNAKNLSTDPLTESLKSYKKAMELDNKGRSSQAIKSGLLLLATDIYKQAIEAYGWEDYKKSMISFELYLEINQLPVMAKDNPNYVDTASIYNAGLCAYKGKDWDKAIKYLSEGLKFGYNVGSTADLLKNAYLEKKDSVTALKVLQETFAKYSENIDLTVSLSNYYIKTNKTDEAIKYLKIAIEHEPGNPSFHCALGSLYEKLDRQDDAIASYQKTIDIDKNYHDAYYYLGFYYIVIGDKHNEIARNIQDVDLYNKEINVAISWYDKAVTMMEKCRELKPDNTDTIEYLKKLYYRLNKKEKYEEMNKLLEK
jgi:tetratricopeptide (TPR) repeat protein